MQRIVLLVIILTNVVLIIFINKGIFQNKNIPTKNISPLATSVPISTYTPLISINRNKPTLSKIIEGLLKGDIQNYAIVVKNLKSREAYYLNEHKSLPAASLYKLWVMGEVERQIKNRQLDENQILSQSVATLNYEFGISPDEAESNSGVVTYSVNNAINEMITVSDNYAAMLLTEKITPSNLSLFVSNNDFDETQVGINNSPETTASDVALFYEKLYNGQLVDSSSSQKMIEFLKDQELNDRIPKYLPLGTVAAHKTGDIGSVTSDAGIVYSKKGDYIIVVMSKTNSVPDAYEMIADISKSVYDYFNNF